MKQLNEDPPPLLERRPELPEHVCEAIHRALSKSADDRFDSIDEFARALQGGAEVEPMNGVRRNGAKKRGLFDAKTLWMRDRLVRVHKRRRLKKWTGRAALTAAASVVVYLAAAAMSSGGASSPGEGPGEALESSVDGSSAVQLPAMAFVEVDLGTAGDPIGIVGPPAPPGESQARPDETSAASNRQASTAARRGQSSSRPAGAPADGSGSGGRQVPAENPVRTAGPTSGGQPSSTVPARSNAGDPSAEQPAAALVTPEMVLERYRRALETEDVDELAVLYGGEVPSEDLGMLTRIFDNADDLQVEMERKGTRNEGDGRQVVDVDFAMRYVLARTQRSQRYTLKLRMTLEESSSGWQLVELDRR
jgi:hypothetical protein